MTYNAFGGKLNLTQPINFKSCTYALQQRSVDQYDSAGKVHFRKMLSVTLTFDLLTSKSSRLIFVLNCTAGVNLVKFPQAVDNISG